MDFELAEMIYNGADVNEVGDYMWQNCREEFNGKFFVVNGDRLYPIIEDGTIISWEWD